MPNVKHIVETQSGCTVHREVASKRTSQDFDVMQISEVTRDSFKRICGVSAEPATPKDWQHALESILGKQVVTEILK